MRIAQKPQSGDVHRMRPFRATWSQDMNADPHDPTWSPLARIAFVAIGAVAYLGFHLAFLCMISFLNAGPLPWSPTAPSVTLPLAVRLMIDFGWILLFGLQHAVMARPGFKRRWTRIVPEPIERSLFVAATVACLMSAMAFWQSIPGHAFQIESGPVRIGLFALQAIGWLTVVFSTFLIDHFELFGLRQVACALRGRALPIQRFRTPALYKVSRHPMMVGMLIALWATPDMSWDRLIFAMGFTVYILVGVRLEERDLVRVLGDDYRRYQQEVARFFPTPRRTLRPAPSISLSGVAVLSALVGSGLPVESRAQQTSTDLSPDTSITANGAHFDDHEVMVDLLDGGLALADLGGLSSTLDLDAYDLLESGDELFSLAEPALLPGGLFVASADVVRWDGDTYQLGSTPRRTGCRPRSTRTP